MFCLTMLGCAANRAGWMGGRGIVPDDEWFKFLRSGGGGECIPTVGCISVVIQCFCLSLRQIIPATGDLCYIRRRGANLGCGLLTEMIPAM